MSEINLELIVHRLEQIVKNQEKDGKKLDALKEEVSKIKTIKHTVDTLKKWKDQVDETMPISEIKKFSEWKKEIDEVVSPTQLKEHIKEIDDLKTFKTKSTMIWVIVQAIIILFVFFDKVFEIF